ncbi:MAG: threonylcarbamoyl-AMP synthase [Veillonella sp.]|nr:threonylcarbamoyl-AMP synthase [Veillonella sp.]
MDTQIITNPSEQELDMLASTLRNGELVSIPTETVYGLGANGLDPEAMDKIYAAKGRPSDNPLILHVPNSESIKPLVTEVSNTAQLLMDTFWPGPLTITLPKSDLVPDRATGGLPRVALRCPDHDGCRVLLQRAGIPIAAPSANISGRPSPTTAQDVYNDMNGRISYILDAGPCTIGVESTVVEVHDDKVIILRPGGITKAQLETVVSNVEYDTALVSAETKPKAPGMKYTHYAPDAPMTVVVGTPESVANTFNELSKGIEGPIGCLVSHETYELIKDDARFMCYCFGHHGDALALGHDFYKSLLHFNENRVTLILAEGVNDDGFGVAIMNRMEKASGHHIIYN